MNTSHGQHIWGTPEGPPYFGKIRNCGGPQVCETCKKESEQYHQTKAERKKEL